MLDAVCEGTVALVVAVAGGTIGLAIFDVLFPPESVNELLGEGGGILLILVGGGVLGGNVIKLKLREEDEVVLKLTLVKAPKPPITIVVLLSVVSLEKI